MKAQQLEICLKPLGTKFSRKSFLYFRLCENFKDIHFKCQFSFLERLKFPISFLIESYLDETSFDIMYRLQGASKEELGSQCLKTVASNGPFLSSTKQRLALFSIWTNTFSDPMIKMNIPMIERRFRQMLLIF